MDALDAAFEAYRKAVESEKAVASRIFEESRTPTPAELAEFAELEATVATTRAEVDRLLDRRPAEAPSGVAGVAARVATLAREMDRLAETADAGKRGMTPNMAADFGSSCAEVRALLDAAPSDRYLDAIRDQLAIATTPDLRASYAAAAAERLELLARTPDLDAARASMARAIADSSQGTSPMTEQTEFRFASALFGGETEMRSVLTTSGGTAFHTAQRVDSIFPVLAAESVFLRTGPRRYTTDSTELDIPKGTSFATVAWKAEGGTASASDAGYALQRVTPDYLFGVSEFSWEAAQDNPGLIDHAASELFRQMGRKLDAAALDAGNSLNISPLHGNAAAGTANAGGLIANLDPFVKAAGSAVAQGVSYADIVYIVGPSTWEAMGTAHVSGTASNANVLPLLSQDSTGGAGAALADGRLLGRPMFISADLSVTGGTAYALCYDPNQIAVVTRRDFTTLVDPVTKAEQGITRLIATMRIGVAAINSKAVAEIGGIVP